MQPHIQVKLLEFEAVLVGLAATRSPQITRKNLDALVRLTNEIEALCAHINNRKTLTIIVDMFVRGERIMDESIRRTLNGPR